MNSVRLIFRITLVLISCLANSQIDPDLTVSTDEDEAAIGKLTNVSKDFDVAAFAEAAGINVYASDDSGPNASEKLALRLERHARKEKNLERIAAKNNGAYGELKMILEIHPEGSEKVYVEEYGQVGKDSLICHFSDGLRFDVSVYWFSMRRSCPLISEQF